MATIPTAALERTRRTSTHRRSLVECASLRIGTSFRIRFNLIPVNAVLSKQPRHHLDA